MVPGAAKELMIGNLDVALNMLGCRNPKSGATQGVLPSRSTAESDAGPARIGPNFSTPCSTTARMICSSRSVPLETRLLACYQHAKADPPITADAASFSGSISILADPPRSRSPARNDRPAQGRQKKTPLPSSPSGCWRSRTMPSLAQRLIAGHLERSLLPQVNEALKRHAAAGDKRMARPIAELKKIKP